MIRGLFAETKDNKVIFIKALNKDCYFFKGIYHLSDKVKEKYNIEEFDFFSSNMEEIKLIEENKIFKNKIINLVDREVNLKAEDLGYEENSTYEFNFTDRDKNINIYAYFKIDPAYKKIEVEEGEITLLKEDKTFSFNELEEFGGEKGAYIVEKLKGFLEDGVLYYDFSNQVVEEDDIVKYFNLHLDQPENKFYYENFEKLVEAIREVFKKAEFDEVA